MKLIDADKLKAHYSWWKGGSREMTMDEAKSDFDTIIDLQPTVEAVPEEQYQRMVYTVASLTEKVGELMDAEPKHGRWNKVVHSNNHTTYYCSECGSIFNKGCADLGDFNYCPNCGAEMQSTMGQVKHGHWVKYGSPLFSEWECSECGERHTGNDLPDKCPHCKARMDEVENGI